MPVIIVYPEYSNKQDIINCSSKTIKQQIKNLWNKIPILRDSIHKVPSLHIPNKQSLIREALSDADFKLNTKCKANQYFYPC